MKSKIILTFLASLIFSSAAFAGTTSLGSGFSCSGDSIMKGSKVVSYTKAKSTLTTTIAKLKAKLKTAPKNKKAGIKAKIKAATDSKTLLTACFKGLLANQVDPIFTQLASGSGLYSGKYEADATFVGHITGDISMQFVLQGTVVTGTLTLGGPLGNSLNAKPLAFQNDVGGIGFPAKFLLQGTFLGDVTLSITQAGHLSITNSNQSKPVDFEGDFNGQSISFTVNGAYSFVTYGGSAVLNRQP